MLPDEPSLNILENGVMRKIFLSNMEEETEGWKNLLNNHLNDFFSRSKLVCAY